jgi:uncharacterized protein YhfF
LVAEAESSQFRREDTLATYDAVAERYAQDIAGELGKKPFDRQFLDRFAASVAGSGRVADASLAGVVCFYSIIHFDDLQLAAAFKEMRRVLSAEGLAAFAFHIGDEVLHRDEWWGTPVSLDARFLDPRQVTQLLDAAGFSVLVSEERAAYAPEVEYQSRRAYIVARPVMTLPDGRRGHPPFGLGYSRTELRRKLVDAVLGGDKVGTAGLARHFAPHSHEPLPQPGNLWTLLGYGDEPVAIVETTRVDVVPAGQVDLDFAESEGEGFESVADWRSAHERFWSDEGITDETEIVCERFRLVEVL